MELDQLILFEYFFCRFLVFYNLLIIFLFPFGHILIFIGKMNFLIIIDSCVEADSCNFGVLVY